VTGEVKLNDRWTPLREHRVQMAYMASPHRFNVIPAGRRSGKTENFKRKLVMRALGATTEWTPRFFAGAPTRDQAKAIFWEDLKNLTRGFWAESPSESHLMIRVATGAEIHVLGMDKPERVEGSPWDGGGLDEYGNCKPTAWTHHIRPALSDRNGWFDLFGVPEGRNHYYDISVRAQALMQLHGAASEWGHYHWVSADILPASEIAAAKRDLDELSFQQEYEASFINFEGRAYYPFRRETHCAPVSERYNPDKPLILCFDFNVAPGVCAIAQEMELPGQFERTDPSVIGSNGPLATPLKLDPKTGKPIPIVGTAIIGEVFIERNSNTPAVCRKILSDWGNHRGMVIAYGDSTGGNRGSAKVMGSDWDLIKSDLGAHFGQRFMVRVKTRNPEPRPRVNSVNTRLLNGAGEIHMMVDPGKAPNVVKDFEGVVLLKGGSGEIDKNYDAKLTHLTDGIGYYTDHEFPIVRPFVGVQPLRGA
jgi:hypothetical protein